MKIINQQNGLNNKLRVFDLCPECSADVTGISLNYASVPISSYDYGDPVYVTSSGNYAKMEPCECKIYMSDPRMKDWTIYRFPNTPEGKAGYNAQVRRKAFATL